LSASLNRAKVQIGLRPVQRCKYESHLRVSDDGHRGLGHSGFSRSAFGRRLQAPAAPPQPPLPTCHLVNVSPRGSAALTFALLHRSSAPICTFALSLRLSRCLPCPPANLSTCQLALSRSEPPGLSLLPPLPTCHRAHVPPRGSAACLPCPPVNLSTCQLVSCSGPPAN
jgi:hypothetical protein